MGYFRCIGIVAFYMPDVQSGAFALLEWEDFVA